MALFLRDFTVLDFAFLSKEKGLLGESLHVSVELEGELDEKGFLFDFGPAKRELKRVVDGCLDHRLVVPGLDPALRGTARGFTFHGLTYEAPAEAIAVLEEKEITIPALARHLEAEARAALPPNVSGVCFLLEEEKRFQTEACFRYTHGLRLHDGNCQRLLHGHRNAIEVWVEGKREEKWERFLAAEWDGAHFAFAPTLASSLDRPRGRRGHRGQAEGLAWVEYEAPQGFFRAGLPAEKIVLMETEPSIENIARLSAERLALEGVRAAKVVAYEGLNKGASFSLSRS